MHPGLIDLMEDLRSDPRVKLPPVERQEEVLANMQQVFDNVATLWADGLTAVQIAPGVTPEEIRDKTGCPVHFSGDPIR